MDALKNISSEELNRIELGEYPLTLGSNELIRIWNSCVNSESCDLFRLESVKISCLVDSMVLKVHSSTAKNKDDMLDRLQSIDLFLQKSTKINEINKIQSSIILNQEADILRREIKIRDLEEQLKKLKENIT